MREKADKMQQTTEKETRRWKDEKKSMADELNATKQTCDE